MTHKKRGSELGRHELFLRQLANYQNPEKGANILVGAPFTVFFDM